MQFSVLSQSVRERDAAQASVIAFPWQLAAVVFAATSVIVGLIWDISWHMTIGRDTFWTPAHVAIYTGGAVAGHACGFVVLRRSFFSVARPTDGVAIWRFFNGPLGGWLCIWGAVAMLTSAPFDDWWHDAYGLDVKIISPPHALLALGFIAILGGALVMAVAEQSREGAITASHGDNAADRAPLPPSLRAPWIVAYTSGLVVAMLSIFTTEYHDRTLMHTSIFYFVSALVFPFILVGAARGTRLRYPATTVALIYTVVMCVQLWLLPLFEGTPKLGPIRTPVTHMVPLDFPLLLVFPALAIDLLMRRTEAMGSWARAALIGIAFLAVHVLTQWPFADFLMSDASRNWLFRTDAFPYMMPQDWLGPLGLFETEPLRRTVRGLAIAAVIATMSARAGMAWGSWLGSVKR